MKTNYPFYGFLASIAFYGLQVRRAYAMHVCYQTEDMFRLIIGCIAFTLYCIGLYWVAFTYVHLYSLLPYMPYTHTLSLLFILILCPLSILNSPTLCSARTKQSNQTLRTINLDFLSPLPSKHLLWLFLYGFEFSELVIKSLNYLKWKKWDQIRA